MSEPFIAEIRMFAGNFAPRNWALCDGQLMPIAQNTALFSLLGTTYGGDGRTTFALPDLRGRAPMHPGHGFGLTQRQLGETNGAETVTLLASEIPAHSHELRGSDNAATTPLPVPADNMLARTAEDTYQTPGNKTLAMMSVNSLSAAGGGQPHNNMQPYLVLNFIIALWGIFPSRN